jgi:hypothetical protein
MWFLPRVVSHVLRYLLRRWELALVLRLHCLRLRLPRLASVPRLRRLCLRLLPRLASVLRLRRRCPRLLPRLASVLRLRRLRLRAGVSRHWYAIFIVFFFSMCLLNAITVTLRFIFFLQSPLRYPLRAMVNYRLCPMSPGGVVDGARRAGRTQEDLVAYPWPATAPGTFIYVSQYY